jgi:Na+-driven multidrug efflux pump
VGQNLGCRQDARAKKGAFTACGLAVAVTAIFLLPIMIFAPGLVSFFNSKPEVVEYGSILLRVISPFYLLLCINQVLAGALRGAGNSRAAMLILLPSFVVFRQIYLFVMANYICNEFIPIAMAYPAGWALASILLFLYYQRVGLRGKNKIVEE